MVVSMFFHSLNISPIYPLYNPDSNKDKSFRRRPKEPSEERWLSGPPPCPEALLASAAVKEHKLSYHIMGIYIYIYGVINKAYYIHIYIYSN